MLQISQSIAPSAMEVLFNVNGFYGGCHAIVIALLIQMRS